MKKRNCLERGSIIEYSNEGNTYKGVLISNNKCIEHSTVFQVVKTKSKWDTLKIENLNTIDKSAIKKIKGKYPEKRIDGFIFNFKPEIGKVFYADLPSQVGHIQSGIRPIVVIKNVGDNVLMCPISSKLKKSHLKTHVLIQEEFLKQTSQVLVESVQLIPNTYLKGQELGKLDEQTLFKINKGLRVQLGKDKKTVG